MSSSAHEFEVDLKDGNRFPTFEELPCHSDSDYDVRFYDFGYDGILYPQWHWCFLVEVVEKITWFRPMYRVKDLIGKQLLVAFYTDDKSPEIVRECRIGDTMAIMYAHSHVFADGQVGVRAEDDEVIKVFHCSLATL